MYDQLCQNCGKQFQSVQYATRYCENKCAVAAWRKAQKQRNARIRDLFARFSSAIEGQAGAAEFEQLNREVKLIMRELPQ
jgi:archaellum biogenesis protein FlaJ (TadC family)